MIVISSQCKTLIICGLITQISLTLSEIPEGTNFRYLKFYHCLLFYKITDITITGNNYLATIPLFKKEYKVSAIFNFNSWTKGNVIRFTLGNDWYQVGDTHPAVWMDTNGVRRKKVLKSTIDMNVFVAENWIIQCSKWMVSQIRNSIYSSNKHRSHICDISEENWIKGIFIHRTRW